VENWNTVAAKTWRGIYKWNDAWISDLRIKGFGHTIRDKLQT